MYIFCSNVKYEFWKTVYLYKTDEILSMTKSLVYIQWLLSYIKEFHELGIHFFMEFLWVLLHENKLFPSRMKQIMKYNLWIFLN